MPASLAVADTSISTASRRASGRSCSLLVPLPPCYAVRVWCRGLAGCPASRAALRRPSALLSMRQREGCFRLADRQGWPGIPRGLGRPREPRSREQFVAPGTGSPESPPPPGCRSRRTRRKRAGRCIPTGPCSFVPPGRGFVACVRRARRRPVPRGRTTALIVSRKADKITCRAQTWLTPDPLSVSGGGTGFRRGQTINGRGFPLRLDENDKSDMAPAP
jgi:hypothetical protein